jgi:FKBP-type peptidyl-prolyl cis-trans isomerase 2
MTIAPGKRVCLEYTMRLEDGTEAETNVGTHPLEFTQARNGG